ncbi:MAG: magnesium transporter [Rhodothalassiaceae bacterium]
MTESEEQERLVTGQETKETGERRFADLRQGEDIQLRPDFIRAVREAVEAGDADSATSLLSDLHDADIADLFEVLPSEERRELARLVVDRIEPTFLSELEGAAFDDVIEEMSPKVIAEAVRELDTDDAVYVLEDLDTEAQQEVLHALTREDRIAVEEGLAYPEESAGRLMQRELIAAPEFWTVGQAIDWLRSQDEEALPSDFYELIVVDPAYRPVGTIPLSHVLRTRRDVKLSEIMKRDPYLVHVATDQEDVARQFSKYHLISAGVVNDNGRLVGVITVDDIVDVINAEAQEDILALAGVSEGDVNISIAEVTKTRFVWLLVNLGTAILASLVIGLFDATIEEMVALAVLMPIVASMGGNAGTQTMAVAVRAIAKRELAPANALRIVGKELTVAAINGVLLALVVALVAIGWFGDPLLAVVLGIAMVINILAAGLSGIVIPMLLERFGIDPAVASSVFVTTITDVVGFFAFLGLAAVILL